MAPGLFLKNPSNNGSLVNTWGERGLQEILPQSPHAFSKSPYQRKYLSFGILDIKFVPYPVNLCLKEPEYPVYCFIGSINCNLFLVGDSVD